MKLVPAILIALAILSIANSPRAGVSPGDTVTKDQADKVADLVSPGNLILVKQGMTMKIVPTDRLEWPPPYKSATEKYSPQVQLAPDGTLKGYSAGLPFPLVDANDPQAALKVMWNFSYRPLYTDDAVSKNVEIASYRPGSALADPIAHFTIGNVGFYNNTGRTEVNPVPTDPEAARAGIRYRFGAYPFLEPSEMRGFGFIRYRSMDPKIEDNSWMMNPRSRRARPRVGHRTFGRARDLPAAGRAREAARRPTRATSIRIRSSASPRKSRTSTTSSWARSRCSRWSMRRTLPPRRAPPTADGRICPGELGDAPTLRDRGGREAGVVLGSGVSIPKRIFYIDSEGWFITASDQYDRDGKLWKTVATFNAYRDRPIPAARAAIWPFKRMFQTALVDEDVTDGFSTVVLSPGVETDEHESWYINMGLATENFFNPVTMSNAAH